MFDTIICTLLQRYTANPPSNKSSWYAPWNSILSSLFPASQGYLVSPQRRTNPNSDLTIEVLKLITLSPSLQLRTVLIVRFKNSQDWQAGIPSLEEQMKHLTVTAFSGTAISKVYWIGVIGSHWRYGIKEDNDGQDPRPLISWHEITHDQASYEDFQVLTTLIAEM